MKNNPDLLKDDLKIINIGLKSFYESLKDQNKPVVHMDWVPPAAGRKEIMEILEKLR